jgi:pyruvate dehydrogenase E1 component beta subunit
MMVPRALEAADILATEGIEAEVIDPRTLVPLDMETIIDSVKKTQRLVVTSEEAASAGVCAEIAFQVGRDAFDFLDAPVERVAAANVPVPFSPPLEQYMMPKVEDIVAAAKRTLYMD